MATWLGMVARAVWVQAAHAALAVKGAAAAALPGC
jgi:hypothetical protein